MTTKDVKNKVVIITGASSGIGRALAERLAARGAKLVLAARRQDRLAALSNELKTKHNADCLPLTIDVSNPDDTARMISETLRHFGRLDVLVNNAGVLYMESILTMPLADMHKMMDTNFWPLIHTVRQAAPALSQSRGQVINIGSGAGRRGLSYMAAYSATKFALTGLTESMRVELAPQKIAFTTVYPGGVETEMPAGVDRTKLPPNYPAHIHGISAERVAKAVEKAIKYRSLEVYVPWWVKYAAYLSVIFPELGDFIVRKFRTPH
jgi:short-subunit dehydrogenase